VRSRRTLSSQLNLDLIRLILAYFLVDGPLLMAAEMPTPSPATVEAVRVGGNLVMETNEHLAMETNAAGGMVVTTAAPGTII